MGTDDLVDIGPCSDKNGNIFRLYTDGTKYYRNPRTTTLKNWLVKYLTEHGPKTTTELKQAYNKHNSHGTTSQTIGNVLSHDPRFVKVGTSDIKSMPYPGYRGSTYEATVWDVRKNNPVHPIQEPIISLKLNQAYYLIYRVFKDYNTDIDDSESSEGQVKESLSGAMCDLDSVITNYVDKMDETPIHNKTEQLAALTKAVEYLTSVWEILEYQEPYDAVTVSFAMADSEYASMLIEDLGKTSNPPAKTRVYYAVALNPDMKTKIFKITATSEKKAFALAKKQVANSTWAIEKIINRSGYIKYHAKAVAMKALPKLGLMIVFGTLIAIKVFGSMAIRAYFKRRIQRIIDEQQERGPVKYDIPEAINVEVVEVGP